MEIYEQLELSDCQICGGGALYEEESGCVCYIMCLDCGCHTVDVSFRSEEEKLTAAQKVAQLWNSGKVISSSPGE